MIRGQVPGRSTTQKFGQPIQWKGAQRVSDTAALSPKAVVSCAPVPLQLGTVSVWSCTVAHIDVTVVDYNCAGCHADISRRAQSCSIERRTSCSRSRWYVITTVCRTTRIESFPSFTCTGIPVTTVAGGVMLAIMARMHRRAA